MRLGTTLRVMLFIRSSRSRGAETRKKLIGFAAIKLDRGPALVRIGGEKGSPMEMRINSVLAKSKWLALPAACFFLAFSAPPADQRIITFQEESGDVSESAKVLVGHWRKTTIGYVGPRDEHLVLHADGTAENWVVTATSQTERTTGQWSVEGKTLKLSFGDNENANPFTIYEGQLVFPNIPKRRQFWEKI